MMTENFDCLFIGMNRLDAKGFRNKALKFFGDKFSGYRFLNIDFLKYKDDFWLINDLYNHFIASDQSLKETIRPLSLADDFNTAIAYLGTYLDRRGFTFDYINSFQEEKAELKKKLKKNAYKIIAITTTLYFMPDPVQEIVQFVREHGNGAKIVAGGVYIAKLFNKRRQEELSMTLDSIGADYYINSYQGEQSFVYLINAVIKGTSLTDVPNLYYKLNGSYQGTMPLKEENKLSDNMVNWRLFSNRLKHYVSIRTSISCLFKCAYCTYPVHGGKYQSADIKGIEYELDLLKECGVKFIFFSDDTFNFPKSRFKKILKMMIKNNYDFEWLSFYRCQFADEETLKMMKESGCKVVSLGLESGNNTILKNMNKRVTVDQYLNGIDLIRKAGIITHGCFVIGFPGETQKTVNDTIELIKQIDFYQPNVWMYLAEAPIAKRKSEFGLTVTEDYDWSHNTMNSETAFDIIDDMIASIDQCARVPVFDFNILMIIEMYLRGMSFERIKDFFITFNKGVSESLQLHPNTDVLDQTVDSMNDLFRQQYSCSCPGGLTVI